MSWLMMFHNDVGGLTPFIILPSKLHCIIFMSISVYSNILRASAHRIHLDENVLYVLLLVLLGTFTDIPI